MGGIIVFGIDDSSADCLEVLDIFKEGLKLLGSWVQDEILAWRVGNGLFFEGIVCSFFHLLQIFDDHFHILVQFQRL